MTRFLMSLAGVGRPGRARLPRTPSRATSSSARRRPCTVDDAGRARGRAASAGRRRRSRSSASGTARSCTRPCSAARSWPRPRTRATTSGCRSTPATWTTSSTSRGRPTASATRRTSPPPTPSGSTSTETKDCCARCRRCSALPRSWSGVRIAASPAPAASSAGTSGCRAARRRPTTRSCRSGRDRLGAARRRWSPTPTRCMHLAGVNRGDRRRGRRRQRRARRASSPTRRRARPAGRLGGLRQLDPGRQRHAVRRRQGSRPPRLLRPRPRDAAVDFVDVLLPNLFGEHGRPGYNSVVATFVDRVVAGDGPEVADRPS